MTDQHEPDQHQPDQHPADGAAPPPERPGTDRQVGRPPLDEGATVPLKPSAPPRPTAVPVPDDPAAATPPQLATAPVPDEPPSTASPRPATGSGRDGPASTAPPASAPPVADQQPAAVQPAAVQPAAGPAGPPAVDDEPTVERPTPILRAPEDVGGATRRLVPPAVVPGPASDTPGIGDSGDVRRSIAEPFPAASVSGDAGPRPGHDEAPSGPAAAGRVSDAHDDSAADHNAADYYAADYDAADYDAADDGAADDGAPDNGAATDRAAARAGEERADDAGSPDPVTTGGDVRGGRAPGVPGKVWPFQKFVSAGVLIWVLLALFGFTLVVQLRSNNSDEGLASARQDDLVRILSDLEARDTRLQAEIAALETSQRQLTSGVEGRKAALAEAEKRADELGLLAGTLPGRGRGLAIKIDGVRASAVLNAVQELRGAGGEVMQLSGAGGGAVRIVASTYFVDADGGGIVADGKRLTGPYELLVIGVPQTMQTALEIPGGVVASVKSGGGSVTMEQRDAVDVTALREATSLQYARPVS